MKIAGIDIGTNTLRLLISEISSGKRCRTVDSDRHITRLGEGLSYSGSLKDEAMDRAISVLKDYAGKCEGNHVDKIYAVATSAVRESANGHDFINRIREETGIDAEIISGDEEARLTVLGVSTALGLSGEDALVMDIGGGSTELIIVSKGEIEFKKSTDIGVVRFTEQFIKSDPPDISEMKLLDRAVEERLEREEYFTDLKKSGRVPAAVKFIGTAGTVTTLAAIDQMMKTYDPEKINGYRMKKENVRGILDSLRGMTNRERMDLPGIEYGREDIILAGVMVVYRVMDWFGFEDMTVSDAGLREGLVAEIYSGIS